MNVVPIAPEALIGVDLDFDVKVAVFTGARLTDVGKMELK